MTIGINASAAFKPQRTGVEEYTYQLLKHLAKLDVSHQVVLYLNKKSKPENQDLAQLANFSIKYLSLPFLWTQLRLAAEMKTHQPDVLFIPVHILPLIHPKNSVVTIHGLEYEYYPEMYPPFHLRYLRWATQYALQKAKKIITVSENTKQDLIKFYQADPEKIKVVYHGVSQPAKVSQSSSQPVSQPFILSIGRLEIRKNIIGLIRAFNKLKKEENHPHQLVLVGGPGYGHQQILDEINHSPFKKEIVLTNYVSEEEKASLLSRADIFVFPSFYEGFGLPILEAMAAHCPVITSNISSLPEVAGQAALLVTPKKVDEIAEAMTKLIKDKDLKLRLVAKGIDNIKRFSWSKCAQETWQILTSD
ncbi:MAG TPA: glycosyltransferase family 1 protein [Candidatus Portnoybacteria bacterium]|nr:glycosyltransferase family 1 protein [Candidatus Portnoybacteria bacterium]